MFVTGEDFQVLNEDRMQEKEDCVVDFAVCFAPAFSSLSLSFSLRQACPVFSSIFWGSCICCVDNELISRL